MICLTGDVHHRSCRTREAPLIAPRSEAQLARDYLEIARGHGLKTTLFVTGRTFAEESADTRILASYDNLEIGGHTYNAFKPLWLHQGLKLVRGSYWGPPAHQRSEIRRTIEIIRAQTGRSVVSWRNHSYEHDYHTPGLLENCGIKVWSDFLDRRCIYPYWVSNSLLALPINIVEDHSSLYHGYITEEWVRRDDKRKNCTRPLRRILHLKEETEQTYYTPREWLQRVMQGVREKVESGGLAVLNLHPVCMYLLDRFQTFDAVCAFLAQNRSIWAIEAVGVAREQGSSDDGA